MKLLEQYEELVERSASEMSYAWKGSLVVTYFLSALSSYTCTILFYTFWVKMPLTRFFVLDTYTFSSIMIVREQNFIVFIYSTTCAVVTVSFGRRSSFNRDFCRMWLWKIIMWRITIGLRTFSLSIILKSIVTGSYSPVCSHA